MVEYFSSSSGDRLPFGVRTVKYAEYVYSDAPLSDGELISVAKYRADTELRELLTDGDLLGITQEEAFTESGYILRRRIRCIRNIAVSQPVEIELFPTTKIKEKN